MDVIADGRPRMLEFGVADEAAWQVGLTCGGRIRIYLERVEDGSHHLAGHPGSGQALA
jgi:xanthine/CO dehydrogenase XdhC/CoxF family maturation factor